MRNDLFLRANHMKGLLDTLQKPFYLSRTNCGQGEEEKPKALPWSGFCRRFSDPNFFSSMFFPRNLVRHLRKLQLFFKYISCLASPRQTVLTVVLSRSWQHFPRKGMFLLLQAVFVRAGRRSVVGPMCPVGRVVIRYFIFPPLVKWSSSIEIQAA